ncbi:hypothetical protein [Parashewanella hymeniacidonis]|uniref:hypothetical protein n=1 Tax=Parashewanella hymeniacidonis TaxID=2807618 RepID=UPI003B84B1F1
MFQAKGELGSNLEYFEKTLQEIRSLNIRDLHMEAVINLKKSSWTHRNVNNCIMYQGKRR